MRYWNVWYQDKRTKEKEYRNIRNETYEGARQVRQKTMSKAKRELYHFYSKEECQALNLPLTAE